MECGCMDGWMDEWMLMDGWMYRWLDGWMDEWITDTLIIGYVDIRYHD